MDARDEALSWMVLFVHIDTVCARSVTFRAVDVDASAMMNDDDDDDRPIDRGADARSPSTRPTNDARMETQATAWAIGNTHRADAR